MTMDIYPAGTLDVACSMSKLTIGLSWGKSPQTPGLASLGVLSLVEFDHCFVVGLLDNAGLVCHW